MKLAILLNSDVMEKNQCQIRIQRPKISKDLLVSSNAQIFVALCYIRVGGMAFFQPPTFMKAKLCIKKCKHYKTRKKMFFTKDPGQNPKWLPRAWYGQINFFLLNIIQKFFFLSLIFHSLVTRNNNFCHPGGPKGSLRTFWLVLGPKTAFFSNFPKKFMFFSFLRFVYQQSYLMIL